MDDSTGYSMRQERVQRQRTAARARRRRAAAAGAIAAASLVLVAVIAVAATSLMRRTEPARVRSWNSVTAAAVAERLPVEAAVQAAIAASKADAISIVAVGDLLFDLGPRRLVAAQGGAAPLAKVADYLKDADLTIANLEGPLSDRGTKVAGKPDHLIFEGDPRSVESLTTSGIDIVTLANNHTMDYGVPAFEDTVDTLDKAGVRYAGAGRTLDDAWKPVIVEVKGNKIAYLAATQIIPAHFIAGTDRPGVGDGKDTARMIKAIRAVRPKVDYVFVAYHWGTEQSYNASGAQVSLAHRCIDAGADMVLSHHPHVMQGIEFYKGKLIAYSLGNFLFPYKTVEGRKSFVLKASISKSGISDVTAWPVYLGEWGRPVHQTGSQAAHILGKLAKSSKPYGTKVVIEGDIARILPE